MSPKKLKGLGYFGFAGLSYMYFPYFVMHFGQTLTMLGMSGASVMGMLNFNERNIVNSIELIKEGTDAGKLLMSVSTSPFTSKNVVVPVANARSVFTVGSDDLGENDIESNVVFLKDYFDCSTN